MLGARGVALGLGRVNLNDLSGLTSVQARQQAAHARCMAAKEKKKKKSKVVVKKRVDRQTLWAACRATIFGVIMLILGGAMSTVGYYSVPLATYKNATTITVDYTREIQIRSLSYIGPVVMGVGAFILMIACVMTLESRDKHATVIHEYSKSSTRGQSTLPSSVAVDQDTEKLIKEHSATVVANDNLNNNNNIIDNNKNVASGPVNETDSNALSLTTCTTSLRTDQNTAVAGSHQTIPINNTAHIPKTISSIDSIEKRFKLADPRELLHRFLDDQSGMMDIMRKKTNYQRIMKNLQKQSNSLDVVGSEKEEISKRNVRSEDIGIQQIVADVHLPPTDSKLTMTKSLCSHNVHGRDSGHAPLVRAESLQLSTSVSSLSSTSRPCNKPALQLVDSSGQPFYTPSEYHVALKKQMSSGMSVPSSHQHSFLPCGSVSASCTPVTNDLRKKYDTGADSVASVSSYNTVDSWFDKPFSDGFYSDQKE